MKPVRALLAVLAIAFAGPVPAQPGIDDPELMAWMQAANAAQKARLEALSSRGDADALLMAMQLVHPMFPLRQDPEAEIAAEQAQAWSLLSRAAQADPEHPVVAWKLATCPTDSGVSACGSPASRERLATLGNSRAEVNLYLAQLMQAVGDEAAFEAHFQAAAEAPRFGAYDQEQAALIWRAWEGIEIPEAGPAVVEAYAQHIEIDPEAFVEQLVAMSVFSRVTGSLIPDFSFPSSVCGIRGEGGDIGEARRRQCLAVFSTMGDDKPTVLQRVVADHAMARLTADAPGADRWKTRLRTTAWVFEAAMPLSASLTTNHDPEYFSVWREEGEYQSMLRLMARRGIDLVPPEGWLPESADMRALLGDVTTDPEDGGPAPDPSAEDAQPE